MDVRVADQARRIGETNDPAVKQNGLGPVSAEWMSSKGLWLKENEPDAVATASESHRRIRRASSTGYKTEGG